MSNYVLDTNFFWDFHECAQKAAEMSTEFPRRNTEFDFNGIKCVVAYDTDLQLLLRDYINALKMDWKEVGPRCSPIIPADVQKALDDKDKEIEARRQKAQKEYEKKQEKKQKEATGLLDGVTFEYADEIKWTEKVGEGDETREIIISGEEGMKRWDDNNKDAYGGAVMTYAKRWGLLMQARAAEANALRLYKLKEEKNYDKIKAIEENPNLIDMDVIIAIADNTSSEADLEGITGYMYGAAVSVLVSTWKYGLLLKRWHNKEYGQEDAEGVVNPALVTLSV